MADDDKKGVGDNILLKGAAAALIVSHLTGQMAKGIEAAERENVKRQEVDEKIKRRRVANTGFTQPVLNANGDPIVLSNGQVMLEYSQHKPAPRPGLFMDPRIPGIGYLPRNSPIRRGRTDKEIIADREKKWYMERGGIYQNGRWVHIGDREAKRINDIKEKDWYTANGHIWVEEGWYPSGPYGKYGKVRYAQWYYVGIEKAKQMNEERVRLEGERTEKKKRRKMLRHRILRWFTSYA